LNNQKKSTAYGFSLLEMIGVLAIMGILAGALAPNIFQAIDEAYATAEEQNLAALEDALRNYVTTTKRIPSATQTDWTVALSEASSMALTRVTNNQRNFARRLYFDPRFLTPSDTNFSGFTQVQGLTTSPVSPRVMIVSDLKANLPNPPTTSSAFNAIWDQTGTPTVIESKMLKIQRVNMKDYFHRIILSNQNTNASAYSIEAGSQSSVPGASSGLDGVVTRYLLTGSKVNLHMDTFPSGAIERSFILREQSSLRYQTDGSIWSWSS